MRAAATRYASIAMMVTLASCTAPASERAPVVDEAVERQDGEARLLVRTNDGIAVVEPATGATLFDAPRAISSPDSSWLYSLTRRRTSGVVSQVDVTTGATIDRGPAPRGLAPAVASANGDLVALIEPHREGATPWLPAGRRHTRIAVLAPARGETSTYKLGGNFEVEGFSSDGRQLFLLEYTPAMRPTQYGLRRLNLDTGNVARIKEAKQNAPGTMEGTGRIATFSPTGHELYTLYTQQGPNYAHGGGGHGRHERGQVHAFVHLLNLEGAWTHCIDLRAPFGTGPVTTHAMAITPDGARLYVADPSSGGLAVIDPARTRVLKSVTARLDALTEGPASATAVGGMLYLGGGSEVLAVDGDDLAIVDRWNMGKPVSGVAVAPDGGSLFVSLPDRVVVLDTATGERIDSIRARANEGIMQLAVGD